MKNVCILVFILLAVLLWDGLAEQQMLRKPFTPGNDEENARQMQAVADIEEKEAKAEEADEKEEEEDADAIRESASDEVMEVVLEGAHAKKDLKKEKAHEAIEDGDAASLEFVATSTKNDAAHLKTDAAQLRKDASKLENTVEDGFQLVTPQKTVFSQ
eukprot:gnl/TRDRNA2_/TRDRNA2_186369_c0_seq1.p1 gnl/TRDRNA2_/TRDRNA2_186369_c0~~gnl/TRDRNA2_/TRDRNA2_186369_c0_seq1.p1  ORF type:complete len:158 (-),score=59.56 gnl/TRDRNA2_/TRDRNA2_186369_c0_seq1:300-773(-)